MSWFDAIVLAIVQGLTEFLPISSSAHIRIFGELLGISDPGATFTAIIQIGTELAVLVFFWNDIVRIIKQWIGSLRGKVPKSDPDARMGWFIIIGSVPIVVLGVLLQDVIRSQFRSLWIIATTLIVFGIILGIADVIGRREKTLDKLNAKDGILYGFAQALSLIPGVSRSGGTITAGRLMGYDRPSAARYSFLLAVPAVLGSGGYELYNALTESSDATAVAWGPTILATILSFVIGWVVIKFLMKWVETRSFMPFVIYRIALGTVLFVLLAFGVIDPLSGAA
ncbi:undecaprenyl-diphosphate phosphatase [Gulosibacter molinativorax]|uniref:Undecaprenyl-diphosphatase n=1 Tax=Gulosibacter molinativorax TaxID=256821 RepID=A0ABT7C4J8_9MICO|nr:undecaprenyl-diphosphate phosphatase [Gulosibacter molinativorax]MDJ1370129.1 undecaprenyl-diphosphate phosphatase [Gulosibacter molinativorax]QUY61540.1 Undecaprenyl-diphosphatase [Gulosibacter molinativorax]